MLLYKRDDWQVKEPSLPLGDLNRYVMRQGYLFKPFGKLSMIYNVKIGPYWMYLKEQGLLEFHTEQGSPKNHLSDSVCMATDKYKRRPYWILNIQF